MLKRQKVKNWFDRADITRWLCCVRHGMCLKQTPYNTELLSCISKSWIRIVTYLSVTHTISLQLIFDSHFHLYSAKCITKTILKLNVGTLHKLLYKISVFILGICACSLCKRNSGAQEQQYPPLLGLYSLSGETSYCKISWSLEAPRFGFKLFQSLWNLAGTSAAALPRCLSNFRAIRPLQHRISRLRDFTRFGGKTPYRLVNRGPAPGCYCSSYSWQEGEWPTTDIPRIRSSYYTGCNT